MSVESTESFQPLLTPDQLLDGQRVLDVYEPFRAPEENDNILSEIYILRSELQNELAAHGLTQSDYRTIMDFEDENDTEQVKLVRKSVPIGVLRKSIWDKSFQVALSSSGLISRYILFLRDTHEKEGRIPSEDAVQNAVVRLAEAAFTHDPERGTYATYALRLLNWMHRRELSVHSPNPQTSHGENLFLNMKKGREWFIHNENREPLFREIALLQACHICFLQIPDRDREVTFYEALRAFRKNLYRLQRNVNNNLDIDGIFELETIPPDRKNEHRFATYEFVRSEELLLFRRSLMSQMRGKQFNILEEFITHGQRSDQKNPYRVLAVRKLANLWNLKTSTNTEGYKRMVFRTDSDIESMEIPVFEVTATEGIRVEDQVIANIEKEQLHAILAHLDETERTVIALHFGLLDGTEYTRSEIGNMIGKSSEQVKTLTAKALRKLRNSPKVKLLGQK